MQATGTLRDSRPSRGFFVVVVAMLCALVVGAAGGYAARSLSPATVGATHTQLQRVDAGQGGPQSDLTRALPSAAPAAEPAIPDGGLIP